MKNKWYWVFKNILIGPFLRVYNRPEIEGKENIPASGSAIIASSHQSVMDSFFFPLLCDREITFLAKNEYFTGTGLVGKIQLWFFTSLRQVPIDRTSEDAAANAIAAARKVFDRGDVLGVYPEGTRSPDGRIYRGKTGMARTALECQQPIVPVAMINSRKANPIGSWIVRPAKVWMKVAPPIDPIAFVQERGLDPDSYEAARALTDHITALFSEMSGYPYVNLYAADVKEALAAGKGYPEGAELPANWEG
ncbi:MULTISPECIES: lysophospholipid acyltransferase family protein [Corynebacterium]|uniref:lysophospholipid acyltransferase family protein n=1 Tax=Corynebacterium TaxID=1716 RepID=UPI00124E67D6|nr:MULTISPECIES: lysophospholipid acyltransferase family protein [Corynebacterium]